MRSEAAVRGRPGRGRGGTAGFGADTELLDEGVEGMGPVGVGAQQRPVRVGDQFAAGEVGPGAQPDRHRVDEEADDLAEARRPDVHSGAGQDIASGPVPVGGECEGGQGEDQRGGAVGAGGLGQSGPVGGVDRLGDGVTGPVAVDGLVAEGDRRFRGDVAQFPGPELL